MNNNNDSNTIGELYLLALNIQILQATEPQLHCILVYQVMISVDIKQVTTEFRLEGKFTNSWWHTEYAT
jgi:hypothetical protein